MKKIKVIKDPNEEIAAEVFESAIVDIANAMKAITKTRLNRETIVTLIKDKVGLNKCDIRLVLDNLENLEKVWLKPKNWLKS